MLSGMRITVTEEKASRAILSMEQEPLLVAKVEMADGSTGWFSQYPDEDYWVADALFTAKSFPVFCNGTGSRCTAARIADPVLAEQINIARFN